jgi:uncharacterized protein
MSSALPEIVDAWRMVNARRSFQGKLPLAAMKRLASSLAAVDGEVVFDLEFDKDALGIPYLQVKANTALPLICQRTLELFALPVKIDTRLGLLTKEEDEASLPADYEPLLLTDGGLNLADVIEDELILAVPVIPVKPGTEFSERTFPANAQETPEEDERPHPFAALEKLYKK